MIADMKLQMKKKVKKQVEAQLSMKDKIKIIDRVKKWEHRI